MAEKTKETPMMKQYNEIKSQYPDAFLFFRLGDFYELFNEDALEAAKLLEITLTSRNKQADKPIPMCGVPYHSAKDYILKLVNRGHKVAICEQVEDPKLTKGMVKREVVRVVTPGTLIEGDSLSGKENNYLATVQLTGSGGYLAYADVSTGEVFVTQSASSQQLFNELARISPRELLLDERMEASEIPALTGTGSPYINYLDFSDYQKDLGMWQLDQASPEEAGILNILTAYIERVQMQSLNYLQPVQRYELHDYLQINYYAHQQLELTQSLRSQRKKGSLLWFIDQTQTAMGGRMLHQWLDKPLLDRGLLTQRHAKVEALTQNYFQRVDLRACLKEVYDLERLVAKISMNTANGRDIHQLRQSLRIVPQINEILSSLASSSHEEDQPVFRVLPDFQDLVQWLDDRIVEDPPISVTEGDLIKPGFNDQLDAYREALNHGQDWLARLQTRERERTGLKTLKVGFNKVFGYYIEISRKQADLLEDGRYHRKQTLANSERFITEELKKIEESILDAEEKSSQLEYELFAQIRESLQASIEALQALAKDLAALDIYCAFAQVSEEKHFVRPVLTNHPHDMVLKASRHPVVESIIGETEFVANDLKVQPQAYFLLLTGPNMSGKSTYMRQVAYCVILNQIGCFVPAQEARLPLVDKIFTRLGSSDDIATGQSTFMVEMMETKIALQEATPSSLLLFDEIGRGTATYDGMALAQGIIQYIAEKVQATTIFSTHYHELTELETEIPILKNIHVGAIEHEGEVVFLHKILTGPADKSYGIHVAKLAGLPDSVIETSQRLVIDLESRAQAIYQAPDLGQVSPFETKEENFVGQEIVETIQDLNINEMTPMEALSLVSRWQEDLKDRRSSHGQD